MASYSVLGVAFCISLGVTRGFTDDILSIPKDLLLGTASAAYQIEGAWNEGGKGESVWDKWTHEHPENIIDGSNGDVACDSYHKYKEDVQLLKTMGVDFYRFSLSWTRILPNGFANVINQEGLNYYKNLIDELRANDIEPFVTLYHWDHPEILERMGGWTNEMMVDWFTDYAKVVFKELGPKVKYFMTLNEAHIVCNEGYATKQKAPGKELGDVGRFLCLHNMLKAHAKTYHMYDTQFRPQQKGQIGLVNACSGAFAKYPNDTTAVNLHFQFTCGWLAHPIFSTTGDYPEVMKRHIAENSKLRGFSKSLLPEFSEAWVQFIQGTSDFFGINHYTSKLVETMPHTDGKEWYSFSGVKESVDPSWPGSASNWLKVVPEGFRQILNKVSEEYNYPPIFVMENGFSYKCCVTDDRLRISYYHSYLKAMLAAVKLDGCKVKAYATWSVLDNFEWKNGYKERFGLINIDFTDPNRTRTPKLSMSWYANVIKTRKLLPISNSSDVIVIAV
ncbi:myrosinase 1 [Pseudomyrmex gracilis]|uniref:myrosinase 1 n=1 Tax=Pseudomyrmex gracilis TaxID=219809 RepID=UPI000994A795|nr:myrosinase 1 [Pseudomyrmex gracilis]